MIVDSATSGGSVNHLALLLAALLAAPAAAAPESPDVAKVHYRQLQETRYAAHGVPLPPEGVEFSVDAATFRLESGAIQPMEPVNGLVTGFVFAGKGRLRFEIPSAFERAQLARFSHSESVTSIDAHISALIVRSADSRLTRPVEVPVGVSYARHALASERRALWLRDWGMDVDARVTAAALNPGDPFFLADVKTDEYGWLCVRFEPWDAEELTLSRLRSAGAGVEFWVSLDQAKERDGKGDPSSDTHRLIDVTHAEIRADLGNHRAELLVGAGVPHPAPVSFLVRLDFEAREDGIAALPFELDELAELDAVSSNGVNLAVLRDDYGKHDVMIADEESVGSLVVLLDAPLRKGEKRSLEFAYRMRTQNYVSGRGWYPGPPDAIHDKHSTRATIVGSKRLQARGAGVLVSDTVDGDVRTSVWVAQPSMMYGFSFGANFKEESIKLDGAPEVLVFGVSTGAVFGKMVRNVAVDVARSQKFFQDYFGLPMPSGVLRATAITAHHGQAFEGLLHLGQWTFNEEHPGASEAFRAHEVAHQYWGHAVGWKGYRDQWLSEAFAEYSALLFVEQVLPKSKYFDPRIERLAAMQLSLDPNLRVDLGPIAAGYRASTSRAPYGYFIQTYEKGALVLHTMRTVMSSLSHDRDLFREVLGDFLKAYQGRDPSTAEFVEFVGQRVPYAWGPFFQAYVYETDIPTFAWRWDVGEAAGQSVLNVTIEASHVPEGFTLAIPLSVDFGDGKVRYTFVRMEGAAKTFQIPVPAKPRHVALNPDFGVLARIERLR
jgi:hypothetical protein